MPTYPETLNSPVIRLLPKPGYLLRRGATRSSGRLNAVEHIRRMRGGTQSHLMRCSDGNYYVVKFQDNPQHRRVLVNELLGTKLAALIGLPTTSVAIIEVDRELIRLTTDLHFEMPTSGYYWTRIPCRPGLQLRSSSWTYEHGTPTLGKSSLAAKKAALLPESG